MDCLVRDRTRTNLYCPIVSTSGPEIGRLLDEGGRGAPNSNPESLFERRLVWRDIDMELEDRPDASIRGCRIVCDVTDANEEPDIQTSAEEMFGKIC
jgi:hypothetical protein